MGHDSQRTVHIEYLVFLVVFSRHEDMVPPRCSLLAERVAKFFLNLSTLSFDHGHSGRRFCGPQSYVSRPGRLLSVERIQGSNLRVEARRTGILSFYAADPLIPT